MAVLSCYPANGHPFASFSELGKQIAVALPSARAVIDGEICSLDRRGRPLFTNLMFRRGNPPCFFAFDLLTYGKDLRTDRLLVRKQELRQLLARAIQRTHAPCYGRNWWETIVGKATGKAFVGASITVT